MSPAPQPSSGQTESTAAKNSSFFHGNVEYAKNVSELETYRNIRMAINPEIAGAIRLLDVGNGGVFDYDTTLAQSIVGVDLFLDETAPNDLPENITLRRGDALDLDEADGEYDRVLQVAVFHHLTGADVPSTLSNIRRAVAEAHRVLEPGGRLVVMESCVSARAFAVEKRLYAALLVVARTRLMSHPATIQFPPAMIRDIIAERFGSVRMSRIPAGRLILQMGHPWPVALTPARPWLFVATRDR